MVLTIHGSAHEIVFTYGLCTIAYNNVYAGVSISRISGKGAYMYKGVGNRFADFISFFKISHENEIIWSQ